MGIKHTIPQLQAMSICHILYIFPAFLATFKQITTASMPIPYLFQSLIGISVPVRKPRTLDLCLLSVYISRFWHLDHSTDIRSKKSKETDPPDDVPVSIFLCFTYSSESLAHPHLSMMNITRPITIPTIVARHIPVNCTSPICIDAPESPTTKTTAVIARFLGLE